jgi:hypothetical protein
MGHDGEQPRFGFLFLFFFFLSVFLPRIVS